MKIAISSDTTRLAEGGQPIPSHNGATLWFHTLFQPLLDNLQGAHTSTILSKESVFGTGKDCLDTLDFYNQLGLEPNHNGWARLFSDKLDATTKQKAYDLVYKHYGDYDFVVGFELPDLFINIFNQYKIPYVDFFIHPVRFYGDLIFAIRTNQEDIYKYILADKNFMSTQYIHNNTVFERSMLYKLRGLGLKKDSCLFLGQTNVDKSLIKAGQVHSLLDYKQEFSLITREYSHVYYKVHPYMLDNTELMDYLASFSNVEVVDQRQAHYSDYNMYRMISQQSIGAIYSLSSSGCYEAKLLGKRAQWFMEYPFNILESNQDPKPLSDWQTSHYVPIYPYRLFQQDFWCALTGKGAENEGLKIEYTRGSLRRSCSQDWGYSIFKGNN